MSRQLTQARANTRRGLPLLDPGRNATRLGIWLRAIRIVSRLQTEERWPFTPRPSYDSSCGVRAYLMRISIVLTALLMSVAAAIAQNKPTGPAAPTVGQPTAVAATIVRHARLPSLPSVTAAANFRLLEDGVREVAVIKGKTGGLEADVVAGKPYVLAPPATTRRAMGIAKLEFPARYLAFDRAGKAINVGGLFLRPTGVPLVWNEQMRAYATDLIVGYDFTDGHEQALASPKTVTLFAEGASAQIKADTVIIRRSGTSGYQRVVLSTNQLEGDTLFTARASPVDELKASAVIHREPGSLAISLPSRQIDGFGLGTATLTITLLARDGFPLPSLEPLAVSLSSRRLRLPAVATLLTGQSTTTAELRSLGYGSDEIRAEAGSLKGVASLRLVFPLAAALATVIGGGLGGAARYLHKRHKKSSLLARRLIEGVIVGVIFVGAVWAGLVSVKLSAGILSTPFGAFALAALSGYVGCAILDRVTEQAFGRMKTA